MIKSIECAVKHVFRWMVKFGRASEIVKMQFREAILIIEPQSFATMFAQFGSEITVSGFAGTVSIQDQENGYTLKHGESFKIPGQGKIVFRAVTQNVPCKVHVHYRPPRDARPNFLKHRGVPHGQY